VRLARFCLAGDDGRVGFGPIADGQAIDVSTRIPDFGHALADPAAAAPRPSDPRIDLGDLGWLPPVEAATKILCVGFNFAGHAAETGRKEVVHPSIFSRFPDSFVGHGQAVLRPAESDQLDWEGEVAAVIGAPGRRIAEGDALAHIAGYTCMAENSVRDWQFRTGQATAGKNWEASGALGPWVTTVDEAGTSVMSLTTRLNGRVVQHDTTDHLIFSPARLISYISAFTPLRAGDVIALGTPKGVGFSQDPPAFLRPGDKIEVEVDAVGVLGHTVVDDVPGLNRLPHRSA
jgi:2-keto-4-pentenoate hydratase/2-oxohepta-3-ene-1,7-dioic acid hydratase in catechol pathway